jgi:hypothetical protein
MASPTASRYGVGPSAMDKSWEWMGVPDGPLAVINIR